MWDVIMPFVIVDRSIWTWNVEHLHGFQQEFNYLLAYLTKEVKPSGFYPGTLSSDQITAAKMDICGWNLHLDLQMSCNELKYVLNTFNTPPPPKKKKKKKKNWMVPIVKLNILIQLIFYVMLFNV